MTGPRPLPEDVRPRGEVKCTGATRGSFGQAVPCDCAGRRYTCPGCLRFVPWCFGAADDDGDVCDDCWGVLHPD